LFLEPGTGFPFDGIGLTSKEAHNTCAAAAAAATVAEVDGCNQHETWDGGVLYFCV